MENRYTTKNKTITKTFTSHGKILLTGEYLVLNGAKGLALATKPTQTLEIGPSSDDQFHWTAKDHEGHEWLTIDFKVEDSEIRVTNSSDNGLIHPLIDIVGLILKQKPELFETAISFITTLEFSPKWGLGTSSTLIANLAKWAEIDPYLLLDESFGGSGYDIAVAMTGENLIFSRNGSAEVEKVEFKPAFSDKLWFIYLNEKRDSKKAVMEYRSNTATSDLSSAREKVTAISQKTLKAETLEEFEELMLEHETILSDLLNEPTVREQHFPDYKYGIVKSLGAWGGDFVLATGEEEEVDYFKRCGFETIISFNDLILNNNGN